MPGDMRNSKNISQNLKGTPTHWAQIVTEIIDKLVGTNSSTSIKFSDLQIDLPRIKGPEGNDLGSARWVINGRVELTTTKSNSE